MTYPFLKKLQFTKFINYFLLKATMFHFIGFIRGLVLGETYLKDLFIYLLYSTVLSIKADRQTFNSFLLIPHKFLHFDARTIQILLDSIDSVS